jgi:isopentenyldiphosphate isomerase
VLSELNSHQAITFQNHIDDFISRSQMIAEVAEYCYQSGVIKSWVNEQYNVSTGFNQPVFFTIERAAATLLGIKKYGIHVNAWVEKQGKLFMWVAKRAKNKFTYPEKLDHLVAGGHSTGHTIEETLLKESTEEANIPNQIASQAKSVSLVSYVMDMKNTLQQDHLFVYDLELNADFLPENTDGEAEEFYLWPIEKVLNCVATTRDYKTNCNLVIIDFAIRHGFLKPDEPYYLDICVGLRNQYINLKK